MARRRRREDQGEFSLWRIQEVISRSLIVHEYTGGGDHEKIPEAPRDTLDDGDEVRRTNRVDEQRASVSREI